MAPPGYHRTGNLESPPPEGVTGVLSQTPIIIIIFRINALSLVSCYVWIASFVRMSKEALRLPRDPLAPSPAPAKTYPRVGWNRLFGRRCVTGPGEKKVIQSGEERVEARGWIRGNDVK